jgi:hypothetical protein
MSTNVEAVWLPPTGRNPLITGRFVDRVDKVGRKRILLETKNRDGEISSRSINDDAEGNQLKTEFSGAWSDYLRRIQAVEGDATEAWRATEGSETSISDLDLPWHVEATFRKNGFTYIEQAAHMSDAHADSLGFQNWRQRARDFLAAKLAPPDPHVALNEEIKRLRKQLTEAHALIAKQKAEIDRIAAEADVPAGWQRSS